MREFFETHDAFTAGADGVHTYRIPSLLVTPGGSLLAFCEARKTSMGDATPTDLVFKRSEDGGRTWGGLRTLVAASGEEAIMNPCPVNDGGTILLACINAHRDGKRQHRQLLLRSADDGLTWFEPVEMTGLVAGYDKSFVPGPGVSVRLSGGRLVIPGNTSVTSPEGERVASRARVMYSDDHGRSWAMGEPVGEDFSNECQAVELADGTLMLNWRNQSGKFDCRGVALSWDGGQTWPEPRRARSLNDPVCQAGFIRYGLARTDGKNRLLFTNLDALPGGGGAGRRNLAARLSYDEGGTWPVKRLVHEGPAAYSCPARLPDGTIAVLYECGENHRYERLRLARFNLAWLEKTAGDGQ